MFTVGGTVGLSYQRSKVEGGPGLPQTSTVWTGFAIPRVGLLIPLGDRLALYPRVGAGFVLSGGGDTSGATGVMPRATTPGFELDADASLLFGITRHVYLSLGPNVSYTAFPESDTSRFRAGASVALGISL